MHKWIYTALLCFACILGLVVLAMNIPEQNAEKEAAPAAEDVPLNAEAAETVYKANCISCHGDQLQGSQIAPKLSDVGSILDYQQIHDQIANGGGAMMAFKGTLSADEIANLSKWLSEMK